LLVKSGFMQWYPFLTSLVKLCCRDAYLTYYYTVLYFLRAVRGHLSYVPQVFAPYYLVLLHMPMQ
jgi:hypothetical protein